MKNKMKKNVIYPDNFNIAAAAADIMDILILEDFLKTHDYRFLSDSEQNELIELFNKANLNDEEREVLYETYKR